MATKKAASSKKAASTTPAAKKPTTTKPTTVKAVEAHPAVATTASHGTNWRRLTSAPYLAAVVAEFIGTFLLAAITVAAQGQPILVLFGLAGIVMVLGAISGSYVNPALTVGAWATRRMGAVRAISYIVAQILGAMLALVLLNSFVQATGSNDASQLGQSSATLFKAAALPAGKEWYVFAAELLGTAILGFAFASTSRLLRTRVVSGLTVGLGVYTALLIGGSLAAMVGATGILNPAVAVSLQAMSFTSIWPFAIYGIASALGAVIGFFLFDFLRKSQADVVTE